jgi:hypothetical protein
MLHCKATFVITILAWTRTENLCDSEGIIFFIFSKKANFQLQILYLKCINQTTFRFEIY